MAAPFAVIMAAIGACSVQQIRTISIKIANEITVTTRTVFTYVLSPNCGCVCRMTQIDAMFILSAFELCLECCFRVLGEQRVRPVGLLWWHI